ncbi:MAG: penicillin-insensitive murein endopeptidase [Roseibium sp.]
MLIIELSEPSIFDTKVTALQLAIGMQGSQVDGLFGKQTKTAVETFQRNNGLDADGRVGLQTGRKLGLPFWDEVTIRRLNNPFRDPARFSASTEFVFTSGVPEGYYSYRPERYVSGKLITRRAIRTNNPGAINIATWQKSMPGYVGETLPDSSSSKNRTTIYTSPQYGVAAWYFLLVVRYERAYELISGGTGYSINLKRLAKAYGLGKPNVPDQKLTAKELAFVNTYLVGWPKWSKIVGDFELFKNSEINFRSKNEMTSLALSMFSHEAGFHFPLLKEEVTKGVEAGIALAEQASGQVASALSKSLSDTIVSGFEFDLDDFEQEQTESQKRFDEFQSGEVSGEEPEEIEEAEAVLLQPTAEANASHSSDEEDEVECLAPPYDEDRALALFAEAISLSDVNTQLDHDDLPGLYGYGQDKKKFGIKEVIDAMAEVGRIWHARHGADEIGVGNISKNGGGPLPPHSAHQRGLNVDLRMIRKDRRRVPNVWQNNQYDRDATQEMIDLIYTNTLIRTRGILFNDPHAMGTRPLAGHDNHLHLQFDRTVGGFPIRTMQNGAVNRPEVREIQRRLNFWGQLVTSLPIDGDFGDRTETEVKAFQTAMSLVDDGRVGSETWCKLGDFSTL